jgi:hypothetical protein
MERAMKVPVALFPLVIAAAVFLAIPAQAFQSEAAQSGTQPGAKESKWQGTVVRVDQDHSMLTIHGGPAPSVTTRQIAYDSSTEWTKVGKPLEQHNEIKPDSFVIVLGSVDKQGVMHASRIDLRLPKAAR